MRWCRASLASSPPNNSASSGSATALGQELQPLAAPRLDQRHAEQRVEQARRLLGADGRHELGRVGAGDLAAERDPARGQRVDDALEVPQLLARQTRQRPQELRPIGVAEEQTQRRRGGLLLAVRVVDEDVVQVRERARQPGGAGGGGEVQHVWIGEG